MRPAVQVVVAALVAVLLGCPAAAVADLPEIQARGALRVIAAEGEQPEMFDFEGDPAKPGLEREMVEGFAGLKRVKLEVVKVKAFADRIPALLRGEGDVVIGLVDTPERRRQIDFTTEVLPVRHVVVSSKPHPAVSSIESFRTKKVGTIKGTTWARETAAAGVPEPQVEYFADTDPMLDALTSGRIEAAVMTLWTTRSLPRAVRRWRPGSASAPRRAPAGACASRTRSCGRSSTRTSRTCAADRPGTG